MSDDYSSAVLRLHPGVRLHVSEDGAERSYLAVNLLGKTRHRLGRHAFATCVAASKPTPRLQLAAMVAKRSGETVARLLQGIDELERSGLITAEDDDNLKWVDRLVTQWTDAGWVEAVDHHLATLDYPFYDYSGDGRTFDRSIMSAYRSQEPDVDRFNKRREGRAFHSTPKTREALSALKASTHEALWSNAVTGIEDVRTGILTAMGATFGILSLTHPRRALETEPRIRRTSPSGGSRHPTEGYLCLYRESGLEAGWYQFSTGTDELVMVDRFTDHPGRLFDEIPGRDNNRVGYLLLASNLDRNMYRYREPRTFRTIFMDVGHIAATFDLACASLGMIVTDVPNFCTREIESALGLDGIREAVLHVVSISTPSTTGDMR